LCEQQAQYDTVQTGVVEPGGCMSLGSQLFPGGMARSPRSRFEFCINKFKQRYYYIGSIIKVNRLMKKMFHSFSTCACAPPPLRIRFFHH